MDDIIVKVTTRLIMPFITLYGVFVIVHGSVSPGGGFAGGAILGAGLSLYTLVFGLKKGQEKIPNKLLGRKIEGLWCFLFMAFVVVFMGMDVMKFREAGAYMVNVGETVKPELISLVTIGIGLKVVVSMISFFHILIEEDKLGGDISSDNGPH